jgi:hypothetical protein
LKNGGYVEGDGVDAAQLLKKLSRGSKTRPVEQTLLVVGENIQKSAATSCR